MSTLTRRFAFLVLAAAFLALPGAAFAAASQGAITYLEGSVTIDAAPASIGDVVPSGAIVRTDKDSLCEITFRERNVIRLGEQTSLVFNPGNLQVGSVLRQGSALREIGYNLEKSKTFIVPESCAPLRVHEFGTNLSQNLGEPTKQNLRTTSLAEAVAKWDNTGSSKLRRSPTHIIPRTRKL